MSLTDFDEGHTNYFVDLVSTVANFSFKFHIVNLIRTLTIPLLPTENYDNEIVGIYTTVNYRTNGTFSIQQLLQVEVKKGITRKL